MKRRWESSRRGEGQSTHNPASFFGHGAECWLPLSTFTSTSSFFLPLLFSCCSNRIATQSHTASAPLLPRPGALAGLQLSALLWPPLVSPILLLLVSSFAYTPLPCVSLSLFFFLRLPSFFSAASFLPPPASPPSLQSQFASKLKCRQQISVVCSVDIHSLLQLRRL